MAPRPITSINAQRPPSSGSSPQALQGVLSVDSPQTAQNMLRMVAAVTDEVASPMLTALLLSALAVAQPAPPPESTEPWQREGWGFGGLPAVNYNSDEGFGFGVVGSAYRYDGRTDPYKTAINLVLFASTKAVHTHNLEVDALEVLDPRLRLTVRGELNATKTSNYCGFGNQVSCDPADADARADELGLEGQLRDDLVRRYYRTRFINPVLRIDARWMLRDKPHRVEIVGGYRASALFPGDFSEGDPWPNSRYEEDFPGGERALMSVLQTGLMVDDRDNEPAPIRGYWVEATVRGASPVWGSSTSFFGFNTTLRGYVPLGTERLVFADRVMLDGMVGEATTLEIATPGGTQRMQFFGHLNAGRGIRLRRFLGKAKAMNQAEIRWTALSPKAGNTVIDIGLLGFSDLGFVGEELSDLGTMFATPLPTVGGGLRVALDKNFVVRADVGVSPIEDWSPSVYIDLRNLF
jgi:hypothetical protein